MTREECVKALQKSAKAEGFITMAELLRFLGMKNRACAKRYVEGCDLIDDKYYYLVSATLSESNQSYDKYSATFERYLRTAGSAFVNHPTGWNS